MTTLWLSLMFVGLDPFDDSAAKALKSYPAAEAGMVRRVVQLPAKDDEDGLKVEIIVGKTVTIDKANRYFFSGKIEEGTVKGFGYPYFTASKLGPMAGTLIGVDPNEPKVERFVAIGGEPFLVRYNSRLPLVVYVPEGVEVRLRIWTAGPETQVDKG